MEMQGLDAAPNLRNASSPLAAEASYIDPNSMVEGTITTERDLRIEGRLSGKIECDGTLYIVQGALVDAEIDADSIVVSGDMRGTVRCRGRLEIQSSGIVRGDVRTRSLVIIEGARYEGKISMEERLEPAELTEPADMSDESPESEPETEPESYSFLRRFTHDDDESDSLPGHDQETDEPS